MTDFPPRGFPTTDIPSVFKPPLPPAGFDPIRNQADFLRLDAFGLPAAPDILREPVFYKLWARMLGVNPASPALRFVEAGSLAPDSAAMLGAITPSPRLPPASAFERSIPDILAQRPPFLPQAQMRVAPRALRASAPALRNVQLPRNLNKSANWSGVALSPNRGERFTRVAGRWTVPQALGAAAPPDRNGEATRCSIWVGLDGRQRWANSMPQLGSEHGIGANGLPVHRLWWQWWVPGSNKLQFYVSGIGIAPGDEVIALLDALSPTRVHFHLKNHTTGLFTTIIVDATLHGEARAILGCSAQWIIERPASPTLRKDEKRHRLHPMPDFGTIALDSFAARSVNPHQAGALREHEAHPGSRLVNTAQRHGPTQLAVVARPLPPRPGEPFRVRYQSRQVTP